MCVFSEGAEFVLKSPKATVDTKIYLLGYQSPQPLEFRMDKDGLYIKCPLVPLGQLRYAWTFKMTNLE